MTQVSKSLPVRFALTFAAMSGCVASGCSKTWRAPEAMSTGVGSGAGASGVGGSPVAGAGGALGSAGSSVGEGGAGGVPLSSGGAGGAGGPTAAGDCSLAPSVPVSVALGAINQQAPAWYATPEALSVAENILYYRNVDGGWPKGIDMTRRTAARDTESTIDNNSTTTQTDYLARVYTATQCARYGDAAAAGIQYLLDAQYDNGGWPQVYPNAEGYPTHITFNDDAIVHVLNLLRDVAAGVDRFAFADAALASNAAAAVEGGIRVILDTQIELDGVKTGWCAQHDEVTLEPAQARSYELPSLSGSEGARLLRFLMTIEEPSPEIIDAVQSAAAWFEAVKIEGIRVNETVDATQETGEDRVVVEDPAAPPIWARFYELGTYRPFFSSRCEVPECEDDPFFMRRYTLAEIDNERRVGYAWYGDWPAQLLSTTYPTWRARWAP